MLKKVFAVSVGAITAVSLSLAAEAKEWKQVTVGVEGAFPPYNLTTPTGELDGLDIDIIKEVCKRASLECKIVAEEWDNQIPSLLANKFDIVLTMGPNPERRKVIDFSDPYVITPNTFLVQASGDLTALPHSGESFSVDNEDGKKALANVKAALKGKTIGAAVATSQLDFIEKNFAGDAETKPYQGSENAKLDLEYGRIDALYDNVVFARDRSENSKGELKMSGPLFVGGIQATNTCLGIRKEDSELKALLNKALGEMRADGTLSKLSIKWFKTDLSPKG